MAEKTTMPDLEPMDTSDVDRWIGVPVGGPILKDPITANDIRRWAQAMQNPNRLFYDDEFAAKSAYGTLVAPQSFSVACADGHGAQPAIQGTVPGSHMLFGGDEWWFYGPRIYPGDKFTVERALFDYRVTHTKFAGPTMFSRGDTTYKNQRGQAVAKQRSTSIRYLASNARKLRSFADQEQEPEWSLEELEKVEREKFAYYRTFQNHVRKTFKDIADGEDLPLRPIGVHTIQSFTTEYRANPSNVWGSAYNDPLPSSTLTAGWLPEMSRDAEKAELDPTYGDGLYYGPSRGHVFTPYARLIGMPRSYGYGRTMGAWVLDYLNNWAGELGFIVHSNSRYIGPALTGDVTYLTGKVIKKEADETSGYGIVTVDVEMKNQEGRLMAKGPAEVQFPLK